MTIEKEKIKLKNNDADMKQFLETKKSCELALDHSSFFDDGAGPKAKKEKSLEQFRNT